MNNFEVFFTKTQEYLNYIKEHYDNVQTVWKEFNEIFKHEKFIYDDFEFSILDNDIKHHDLTKLTSEEFIQYRNKFFNPYKSVDESIIEMSFEKALENHKHSNDHHWEKWTTTHYTYERMQLLHCVHMLADWIAMGMKFNSNAIEYYKENKDKIILPNWADKLVIELLTKYYNYKEENENK